MIEECNTCRISSISRTGTFTLCNHCSEKIEAAREVGKEMKTIDKGPYHFCIRELPNGKFKIDVSMSKSYNNFMAGFLSIKECEEFISMFLT